MTATAAPFGLRPVGKFSQGSLEHMTAYPIAAGYATAMATGDIVMLVDNTNVVTIEREAATGDDSTEIDIVGIFMGCSYTDPTTGQYTNSQVWPASNAATDALAYVIDDPDVLFEIQCDAAVPTNDNIIYGKNTLLINTAPNTTLGVSRVALDISEVSTDPQNPIRIVGYRGGPQGDEIGSAFPVLVCKFNYHQHSSTTGSA